MLATLQPPGTEQDNSQAEILLDHDTVQEPPHGAEQVQEIGELPAPSLKLVLWEHVPENIAVAAAELHDCDILALEYVGSDETGRRSFEDAANVYLSSTATATDRANAEGYLLDHDTKGWLYSGLLSSLRGTDKKVVLLDLSRDDPEYTLVKEGERAGLELENALKKNQSNDKLKQRLIDTAEADAASNEARELRVIEQLHELLGNLPAGRKAGALLGVSHTSVLRAVSRNYPTEHVYINNYANKTGPLGNLAYYPGDVALARHASLKPDTLIPDVLLDKAILSRYTPDFELIRDMSNTEAAETVVALEALRRSILTRLRTRNNPWGNQPQNIVDLFAEKRRVMEDKNATIATTTAQGGGGRAV